MLKIISSIYGIDRETLMNDHELAKNIKFDLILNVFISFIGGYTAFFFFTSFYYLSVSYSALIAWTTGAFLFFIQNVLKHSFLNVHQRVFSILISIFIAAIISVFFIGTLFRTDINSYIQEVNFARGTDHVDLGMIVNAIIKTLNKSVINQFLSFNIFLILIGLQFLNLFKTKETVARAELKSVKVESKKQISSLFEQQVKALSYIQHELGNKLPAVKSEFSYLKRLISEGSDDFNLSTKVRQPLDGEDPSKIDVVGDIINRIEEGLTYSMNSLQNAGAIISASKQQLHLEKVNLLEFLKGLCRKTISNNQQVDYRFSGDTDLYVEVDKEQFTAAINNIISNALYHGFKHRLENNKIAFNIKSKKDKVELIIKNNGEPFPDDFTIEDFLTPHRYAGATGKTGMGGHFVGIIFKKHNAEISLLPYEQEEEYKVKFLITLERA